jgi:hypothetical protein
MALIRSVHELNITKNSDTAPTITKTKPINQSAYNDVVYKTITIDTTATSDWRDNTEKLLFQEITGAKFVVILPKNEINCFLAAPTRDGNGKIIGNPDFVITDEFVLSGSITKPLYAVHANRTTTSIEVEVIYVYS